MNRAAAACVALWVSAACGQAPEVSPFGRRFDGFRQLFADRGFVLGTPAELDAALQTGAGGKWLVVALGDVRFLPNPAARANELLAQGGTLLAATDWPDESLADLGVRFRRGPALALDPRQTLNRNAALPKLAHGPHPALPRGKPTYANFSGFLELAPHVTVLANLPRCRLPDGRPLGNPPALAALSVAPHGRALFAADHSMFVNEMFLDDANQPLNAFFAAAALNWLARDRPPADTRVLFLEEGVPLAEWTDPRYVSNDWRERTAKDAADDARKWLNMADRVVHGLETRRDEQTGLGLGNLAARRLQAQVPEGDGVRVALAAVLGVLALGALRWLWRGRTPARLPPAPVRAHAALADLRRRAATDRGEHAPLARLLAAAAFRKWLGATPLADQPIPAPPPELDRAARKAWGAAWRRGRGDPSPPLNLRGYRRFHAELTRVDRLLSLPNTAKEPPQ